jgi:hypothetical protein
VNFAPIPCLLLKQGPGRVSHSPSTLSISKDVWEGECSRCGKAGPLFVSKVILPGRITFDPKRNPHIRIGRPPHGNLDQAPPQLKLGPPRVPDQGGWRESSSLTVTCPPRHPSLDRDLVRGEDWTCIVVSFTGGSTRLASRFRYIGRRYFLKQCGT